MEIREFQRHIERLYAETDRKRGSAATFLWLMEEVGELASALAGDDQANKEEEFADVVAWLCSIANVEGVDLQDAIRRKYIDSTPEGTK